MLLHSFFLLLLGTSASALTGNLIEDCTVDGKFTADAINCENALGNTWCDAIFPISTYGEPVKGGLALDTRIPQCYAFIGATPPPTVTTDPEYIKAATLTCAKRCAFCCKTPAYNCKNRDEPDISCESVTPEMCKDSKWRDTIAVNCPNKCGFCLDGGCVDAAVDCDKEPKICTKTSMATFVRANCKRTCGFCTTNTTDNGAINSGACGDSHPNCANWVHNGFCQSNGYTTVQKRQYCGRSCNLC